MSLAGVRVLLVEDEPIIAMTAEDMLEELGCTVVETVASLAAALGAAERGDFDLVLLDINLNGTESHPVADRLRAAGRPFVFTTGYGAEAAGGAPVIAKPYQLRDLEAAISNVLGL
jgi:CheY-like chemotaxis protein